jgi:hypothetical protein
MDRRLKIITIAISLVYLVIIGGIIQSGMADFVSGFKQGFNDGMNRDKKEGISTLSGSGTFFLSLKPENGKRTFPTVITNQLDRKPMKAELESVVVDTGKLKVKLPRGTIAADICTYNLCLLVVFLMVLIPVQTFRVIRSITRNKIFDLSNISKLRNIGYSLLAFYAASIIVNFLHYRIALHVVQVEGYSLKMDWDDASLVLLGLLVLLFAEVLKISVQLKEEQELTV